MDALVNWDHVEFDEVLQFWTTPTMTLYEAIRKIKEFRSLMKTYGQNVIVKYE